MELSKDEFTDMFNTIRREHPEKSMAFCYEHTEVLHSQIFGKRKYADYNSFQTSINRK